MEMDRMLKFTVKTILLFIIINLGMSVLVPIIMGVINNGLVNNDIQKIVGSEKVQSFVAWLTTVTLMMWVLWADSKKNTAYQCFDGINTAVTFLLVFVAYFMPVLYIDEAGEQMSVFLKQYFFGCLWIKGDSYETGAMLAVIFAIIPMLAIYLLVHYLYLRKHPELND